MDTPSLPEDAAACPTCGGHMLFKPAPDNTGDISFCPSCSSETKVKSVNEPNSNNEEPHAKDYDPSARFRDLISQYSETSPKDPPPDSLLEELPEEVKSLLSGEVHSSTSPAEEPSEDKARSLSAQGDSQIQAPLGVNINGDLTTGVSDISSMSPYDIVRMAADLEGGIVPPEKRVHCPKCDAVVPIGASQCQMCGEPIPPSQETTDQD
jgi:uncharacterized Zn finger protein (UPF0148 family)